MKILIVDQNSENQAFYAEKLNRLPATEVETLDLHVMLVDAASYLEHISNMDLIVLGSGLHANALAVARKIKELDPQKNILAFVDEDNFNTGIIKQAHYLGIRRIMSDTTSNLEFLQELFAIDAESRRNGNLSYANVIVITSPKGGAGATSLIAALGELASSKGKRTLLWDLDSETHDLSRALSLYGQKNELYPAWIEGQQPSLKFLQNCMLSIDSNTDLLTPPSTDNMSFDVMYHNQGLNVLHKVLELARYKYDNIIIDLGQTHNPGAQLILQQADKLVLMTGECALSVTACELFLEKLTTLFSENLDGVRILCTGDRFTPAEIKQALDEKSMLPQKSWDLPVLPGDGQAWNWPGSGKTLYSLGNSDLREAIEGIAESLNLIEKIERFEETPSRVGRIINLPMIFRQKQLTQRTVKDEAAFDNLKRDSKSFTL